MSSAVTGSKDKLKIFETILCSPGMNEKCKISLVISRQNILILSRLIEAGLLTGKNSLDDEIIGVFPKDSLDEFKLIHEEILKKGDLAEFYQKLKTI